MGPLESNRESMWMVSLFFAGDQAVHVVVDLHSKLSIYGMEVRVRDLVKSCF